METVNPRRVMSLPRVPFRPSYEGWKRRRRCRVVPAGYPFRPSYEGWKPENVRKIYKRTCAFRPSYEGWKQNRPLTAIREDISLLDLPMRDGNFLRTYLYLLDISF